MRSRAAGVKLDGERKSMSGMTIMCLQSAIAINLFVDTMKSKMFERIRKLISKGYYNVKLHTRKRMLERNIKIKEVKEAIENGTIIEEYEDDKPLPSYLIYGKTSELRPLHVVVGVDEEVVAIITVYEPDPNKWIGFIKRR